MKTDWIWTGLTTPPRNAFVRFRSGFVWNGESPIVLKITADSCYWLYLNGEFIGMGPVRSWPNHWKFDEYNIGSLLQTGKNVIAVLVNHLGEGNFQYLAANPGLWVEALCGPRKTTAILQTGSSWKCSLCPANASNVPRVSVQGKFEEQFDARGNDAWTTAGFDDSKWPQSVTVDAPHLRLKPRGIPLLTREPVFPKRVIRVERTKAPSVVWSLRLKPYYAPGDFSSNQAFVKAFLFTQIWSETAQVVTFLRPHYHSSEFKVNGKRVPALHDRDQAARAERQKVNLRAGWNPVLIPYPSIEFTSNDPVPVGAGPVHSPQFVLSVDAKNPIRWAANGEAGGAPWAYIGPFALTEKEEQGRQNNFDYPRLAMTSGAAPGADAAAYATFYASGGLGAALDKQPCFREIREEDICATDVAATAMAEEILGAHSIENAQALLSDNAEWAVLPPTPEACDVRVLLDFGREILGHHCFEIDAAEGTILDFHNFEFIQADGRENGSEGMNNSFRYICRNGRQTFRSLQRRGFQYSWLIARNLRMPLRIRAISVEFTTYPQNRHGSFWCNDQLLNQIWEVGAHTIRCCSEDTYTDCPTYEQTHWVGDARNEALIDWVVNGDPKLWFRCLEQTGQSLERSPISLSQVPSAWQNVLPAWSFLWMRSCREYLLWTGDYNGAAKLLPWVKRNVEGILKHLNAKHLFEIHAWNMFDWAAMDTPSHGVVTHNNCFAVLALNDCAELAEWLDDQKTAIRFRAAANALATTINSQLWDSKKKAYVDSIHADGTESHVFSQQTQTVAMIAGVAKGARAKHCREILTHPPKDFVKAGSPFFEFFLLEVLASEGLEKEFLDVIRKDWGFMIEQGASTFWEMWSLRSGRLTRSHCHGWSAAPTFFLSSNVMGIRPTRPGFEEIEFTPRLGDLQFVQGTVPSPHGPIAVRCERQGSTIRKEIRLPKGVRLKKREQLPKTG